jgi:hypothetical protein
LPREAINALTAVKYEIMSRVFGDAALHLVAARAAPPRRRL